MDKKSFLEQVSINDNWIHVDGVGRIGLYSPSRKVIGLDYSMKWIVGSNDEIPCSPSHADIKEKIFELFNNHKTI